MPKIDASILKGVSGADIVHSRRFVGEELLEVSVLNEYGAFDEFVDGVYDVIEARWVSFHFGSEFPVTQDQFRRYAYTAVAARVARVRGDKFHVRCDDAWTIPPVIAAILAGLGRVTLENQIVTIVPKWDKRFDAYLLGYDEWAVISRHLRAVEKDPSCKFVFAHAIEGNKTGDEALMSLIPVTDETGRLVELRQQYEIHPIAAAAFLILGLVPLGMGSDTLPEHPLLRSPHYIQIAGVRAFLHRFYDAVA
jgi:hypothetical protein